MAISTLPAESEFWKRAKPTESSSREPVNLGNGGTFLNPIDFCLIQEKIPVFPVKVNGGSNNGEDDERSKDGRQIASNKMKFLWCQVMSRFM